MAGEGGAEKRWSRRDFLKAGSALAAGAAFSSGSKETKGATPGSEQMKSKENPEKTLKDRNTTIDVEKKILSSFNDADIVNIGDNIIPAHASEFSKKYAETVAKMTFAGAGTALAAGAVLHLSKKEKGTDENIANEDVATDGKLRNTSLGAAVIATIVLGAKTADYGIDFFSLPSLRNIQDAEKGVSDWITNMKREKGDSVEDAIKGHIGELSEEQKENIKKLSPAPYVIK